MLDRPSTDSLPPFRTSSVLPVRFDSQLGFRAGELLLLSASAGNIGRGCLLSAAQLFAAQVRGAIARGTKASQALDSAIAKYPGGYAEWRAAISRR